MKCASEKRGDSLWGTAAPLEIDESKCYESRELTLGAALAAGIPPQPGAMGRTDYRSFPGGGGFAVRGSSGQACLGYLRQSSRRIAG